MTGFTSLPTVVYFVGGPHDGATYPRDRLAGLGEGEFLVTPGPADLLAVYRWEPAARRLAHERNCRREDLDD